MLAAPVAETPAIDRTACPSRGGHGTRHHRYVNGCACPDGERDAKRARWRKHTRRLANRHVSAVGTARLIQAAAYRGHTSSEIGAALGVHRTLVNRWRDLFYPTVTRDVAERVRRVVGELHEQSVPADRGHRGANAHARARAHARRAGYVPLGAWDDIDDPNAVPDRTVIRDGAAELTVEDIRWLMSQPGGRHTAAEIGRMYGLDTESVTRRLVRARPAARLLSNDDVYAIRAEYVRDPDSWDLGAVAARYGTTKPTVSKLIHGRIRPELELTDLTLAPRSGGAPSTHAASPAGDNHRKESAA